MRILHYLLNLISRIHDTINNIEKSIVTNKIFSYIKQQIRITKVIVLWYVKQFSKQK